MTDHLAALGAKVKDARLAKKLTVEGAARKAEISRVTWQRVETGLGVQDVKRAAVLAVVELDHAGRPVGGPIQDAGYVASPGPRVDSTVTNDDVLAELRAMREEQRAMRERLEKLEQPGS